jgi:hypothetical protein
MHGVNIIQWKGLMARAEMSIQLPSPTSRVSDFGLEQSHKKIAGSLSILGCDRQASAFHDPLSIYISMPFYIEQTLFNTVS